MFPSSCNAPSDILILINSKLSSLISSQLSLISRSLSPPPLPEDIFQNILMGVLTGEEKYKTVFNLLYRACNKPQYHRNRDVGANKILKWMEKQEIRKFVIMRIKEEICKVKFEREEEQIHTPQENQQHKQEKSKPIKDTNYLTVVQALKETHKKHETSPASTLKEEIKQEDVFYERQSSNKGEEEGQNQAKEGDLFELLGVQNNRVIQYTSKYQQKYEQQSPQQAQNQNLIIPSFTRPAPQNHSQDQQDSLHQDLQSQHFTLLKMKQDKHREDEDDQGHLVSQISSFAQEDQNRYVQEEQFCQVGTYQIEDTCQYGHVLYGDKIAKIIKHFCSEHSNLLLIKWQPRKDGSIPLQSILEWSTVKDHCPQQLIAFAQPIFMKMTKT